MILSDRKIKEYGENLITPFNKENVSASSYDVVLDNQFKYYLRDILRIDVPNKTQSIEANRILLMPTNYEDYMDIEYLLDESGIAYNYLHDTSEFCENPQGIKIDDKDLLIHFGGILGTTKETVKLPKNIACQYQGRSSYGRLFLQSHQTAGWIDSGYFGKITLEITALDKPVLLEANKRIGQLIFSYLTEKCQNPYNGKYQGQDGVVESKIYQDVK